MQISLTPTPIYCILVETSKYAKKIEMDLPLYIIYVPNNIFALLVLKQSG